MLLCSSICGFVFTFLYKILNQFCLSIHGIAAQKRFKKSEIWNDSWNIEYNHYLVYCIAWNEVSDSDVCCSMEHFRLIPLIFCIFSDLNNTHSQNLHHKLSHIYCIFLWTVLVFILFSFTYHTLNISALACNETSNLTTNPDGLLCVFLKGFKEGPLSFQGNGRRDSSTYCLLKCDVTGTFPWPGE